MQKKIIFLLALISIDVSAEVNSAFLNILQSPIEPKISCHIEDELRFRGCLEKICGPSETNVTYRDLFSELVTTEPTTHKAEEEAFKTAAKKYIGERIRIFENIDKLYQDPKKLADNKIEGDLKNFHKFYSLMALFDSIKWQNVVTDMELKSPRLNLVVDDNKMKEELGPRAQILPLLKEVLKNPDLQVFMHAAQYGWTLTNKSLYPNLSQEEIVKNELANLEKMTRELQTNYPKAFELIKVNSLPDSKLIEKIRSSSTHSERVLGLFFEGTTTLKIVADYMKNGAPEFNKYDPKKLENIYSEKEIKDKKKENAVLLKNVNNPEIADELINRCVAIFRKNQIAMPTGTEAAAFYKKAEALRASIKTKLETTLSQETAKTLSTPLDDIYLQMPSTKDEMAQLMVNESQDLLNSLKLTSDIVEGKNSKLSSADVAMGSLHNFMAMTEDSILEDLNSLCDDYEVSSMNDASYNLGTGKILISWLSVKSPQMGEAALAHEFGHAIAHIIQHSQVSHHSALKFKQSRECMSSKMPLGEATSVSLSTVGKFGNQIVFSVPESQYTEENWADLFSTKFTPDSTPNLACFLLDKANGKYNENILMPEEHSDTHAPTVFRALHAEFIRTKTLPAACLEVLSVEEKQNVMSDCL